MTTIELFFNKLNHDDDFASQIFVDHLTAEDVQTIANENGIDLSLAEIHEAKLMMIKAFDLQQEGDLSDEILESVAGGKSHVKDFVRDSQRLVKTNFKKYSSKYLKGW